jgi:hypothetical protein
MKINKQDYNNLNIKTVNLFNHLERKNKKNLTPSSIEDDGGRGD